MERKLERLENAPDEEIEEFMKQGLPIDKEMDNELTQKEVDGATVAFEKDPEA